ncbi:hypothetical protein GVN16_12090 [Emticicia sp. CRIBPO]|uniref:Ig-like domain-containing protein n=1 Tax=Emticicia sp. CRIBPO TaxID=2683258 RepID=UPI001412D191|nr:Ig-like domain-containing protein [Emticicia sp. CRIBPO]NBA86509.1 hypothetical protein [Emticicia sp. CRIBPO]
MKKILPAMAFGLIIWACGDNVTPYEINKPELQLYYNQTHQFEVSQANVRQNAANFSWNSSNPAVGTVDASGLFKGKKIGITTITGSSGKSKVSAEVTIKPYITLCKEPVLEFGLTSTAIKSKETRTLVEEDGDGLHFKGENANIRAIIYTMKNGKMDNAAILLKNDNTLIPNATTFLKERYTFVGTAESVSYFSNGKNITPTIGNDKTLGLLILYLNVTKSARVSLSDYNDAIKELKKRSF